MDQPKVDRDIKELQGSTRFSTVDMNHSFRHFILEDSAMKLFMFRSPWGLFRYQRLVMGNSLNATRGSGRGCWAARELPRSRTTSLSMGRTRSMTAASRRCWRGGKGLTLRKEKCHLGQREFIWFGMVFSEEGITADPEKAKVWPSPTTVRDVKSFCQTVQFNLVYMATEEDS